MTAPNKIIIPILLYFLLVIPDQSEACGSKPSNPQCRNIIDKLRRSRNRRDLKAVGQDEVPLLVRSNRTKRASHAWIRDSYCVNVYKEWFSQYHQADSWTIPENDGSPITYVGYKTVYQSGYPHGTIVVTHVHCELYGDWEWSSNPRNNFGSIWNRRMTELGKKSGDEKGHILASQLGGPATWYNLAPQTQRVNRNVGNAGGIGWYNMENEISTWVRTGCGRVDIDVFLNYGQLRHSVRPKGFKVCCTYKGYSKDVELVDSHYFENGEDDHWSDDEDPDGDELL